MGAFERREIFLRAADVMARRGEEAIVALARETGASRLFSQFNLAFCVQVLREAAAAITRPAGELLPTSIRGACSMARRIPFGVVGAISPWNAPLVLGIRSIAIPLAVGNTVVMKPSEDAPITCGLLLADVLAEAGLPAGVLNVVTSDLADAGEVVAALIADPAGADGELHRLDQRRAHHRGPGRPASQAGRARTRREEPASGPGRALSGRRVLASAWLSRAAGRCHATMPR